MLRIVEVSSPFQWTHVKNLLLEYGRTHNRHEAVLRDIQPIGEHLPSTYPANGSFYLALWNDQPAGCVELCKRSDGTCEMRRLFVSGQFRGKRVGKALVKDVVNRASQDYQIMRIDTHPWMRAAESLYRSIGFTEVEAYRYNPVKGVRFYELDLNRRQQRPGSYRA